MESDDRDDDQRGANQRRSDDTSAGSVHKNHLMRDMTAIDETSCHLWFLTTAPA